MRFKIIFWLIACLNLTCITAQKNNGYNLLWKIEGKELRSPSYLFGTMHVRNLEAFNFSDSVLTSLEKCSAFAMEIHPDTMIMDVFNGLFNNDSIRSESKLKEILSESDYNKLDKRFNDEFGYSIDRLKVKNPYFIKSMLNRPKASPDDKSTFVDTYLYGISKTLNKTIYGLEKTEDQLDFFNSLSKKTLEEQFQEIIEPESDNSASNYENLLKIYARGNLEEINAEVLKGHLYDSALIKRNKVMVNKMKTLMAKHSLFTAVGAAHLPGEEGIIQLLKDLGYKVSPVAATFTGISKKYSIDPMKMKWIQNTDSVNALKIESPGPLLNINLIAGVPIKTSIDLSNMQTYGYYAINMSESQSGLNEEKIIERIIDNYRSNKIYKLEKSKQINVNGLSVKEIIVKTSSRNYLRMRLFAKNNILYGLLAGGESNKLYTPEIERYFNSFAFIKKKPVKDKAWIIHNNTKGAFSIALPIEPKLTEKQVKSDGENETLYTLNIYMSTYFKNMTNYLIRYNDYPEQMYINNNQKVFDAIIGEVTAANKLISGPDTIWKDGYEGRKFMLLLQDKYYTEGRIYLRGNRTYFLIKQNMNANSEKMSEDSFFDSFTFEPYQNTDAYVLKPDSEDFEVMLPVKPRLIKDTSDSFKSSFGLSRDFYSTNPSSGGLYQFEYTPLSNYFKTKSKTDYYDRFIKNSLSDSDTLLSSDSVTIAGYYGREYVTDGLNQNKPKRFRIWFAGNLFFYMAAYGSKDELFNDFGNKIFNSFKPLKPLTDFDVTRSKSESILAGLLSKDSLHYQKSLGAFNYYDFDKTDLPKLTKALAQQYYDDTSSTGARSRLIEAIGDLKDTLAFASLTSEFYSVKNNDQIKSLALTNITRISATKGLPIYLQLLRGSKRLEPAKGSWQLFSPLRDSLEYTREQFELLLPLFDTLSYRRNLLSIAQSAARQDTTGTFTKKHAGVLTKHAETDLAAYIEEMKDTSRYEYHSEIYNYLYFFNEPTLASQADRYTRLLLSNNNIGKYFLSNAFTIRIKHKLVLDKKLKKNFLEDYDTRYEQLTAYEDAGELGDISSKYASDESLGKLLIHNYVSEETDSPAKIKKIGTVNDNGNKYIAFSITFKDDEKKYFGISGPFSEKKKTLKNLYGYTNFDEVEKNWKEQAIIASKNL